MGPPIVNGPFGIMGTVTTVGVGQVAGVQFIVESERLPAGPAPQFTVTQLALVAPGMVPPFTLQL